MKKILIIGFSVTVQSPGYFELIQEGTREIIKISFHKTVNIMGFLLKIGPETGFVKIETDGKMIIEKLIYDERSYYERFFPFFFRAPNTDELTININRALQRAKLLKGEAYVGPQSVSIAGVFCSNKQLPF